MEPTNGAQSGDNYDPSTTSIMVGYNQSPQYHHYNHQHHQVVPSSTMTISRVGLPIQYGLTSAAAQQPQLIPQQIQTQAQCHQIAIQNCRQHHHEPIYNQIYQSLQSYQKLPGFQPTHFKVDNNSLTATNSIVTTTTAATLPRLQPQQNLFVNTNRHTFPSTTIMTTDTDIRPNLSLNLQQQQLHQQFHQLQHQSQKAATPMLATISNLLDAEKSSILPSTQFALNTSPTMTNLSNTVGTNTEHNSQWLSYNQKDKMKSNLTTSTELANTEAGVATATTATASATITTPTAIATTNQRRKLVDSSSGSSSTSSQFSSSFIPSSTSDPCGGRKFKTYLTHLVLASNIPFAYAIIMVAFLITFIAATSIITILTIVLTITGYPAYPVTENTFNTSLIIGVVCASFALALVIASLVVWRRHCQAAYYYLDDPQSASRGTNSPQLSETYDDSEYGSIPVNDWAKHVQKLHVDGDIGFSREFEQIQKANNSSLTYDHSQLPENKHKNRYINIVAYDHTRVPLRQLPGQKKPGSDYINANFIDVSIGRDEKALTQNPVQKLDNPRYIIQEILTLSLYKSKNRVTTSQELTLVLKDHWCRLLTITGG